jgi:hypothetical protein
MGHPTQTSEAGGAHAHDWCRADVVLRSFDGGPHLGDRHGVPSREAVMCAAITEALKEFNRAVFLGVRGLSDPFARLGRFVWLSWTMRTGIR